MSGTRTTWSRVSSRIRAAVAVVAIVAASVVGLHDWADGAATHEVVADHGISQEATAG